MGALGRRWSVDTYSRAYQTGTDDSGDPIFGAGVTGGLRGRWEGQRMKVRDAQGEEVVSERQLYALEPLDLNARYWPPGASDSDPEQAIRPTAVEQVRTVSGRVVGWVACF